MYNSERKFGRITVSIQMINQMVHLNASLKAAETQTQSKNDNQHMLHTMLRNLLLNGCFFPIRK